MKATSHRDDVVGVIGKDGRTDAIAERCALSPTRPTLWALTEVRSPGLVAKCGHDQVTVVDDICNLDHVLQWADRVQPSLVIIGPEEPLDAGVVDVLAQRGIACFGPTKSLARIESSKSWARRLVSAHGIAGNPEYRCFEAVQGLETYLRQLSEFVVKPDGLTGGKGVRVFPEHFDSFEDAVEYAQESIDHDGKVVIEERLDGEEFSLMSITDGESVVHCPAVQDHKRADEDDTGPNTGGMGSYSCADFSLPFLSEEDIVAARRINESVVEAIRRETGEPYRGVLYGGFMATSDGVRLIEYNCRFGDPEALNVLPLLEGDFVELARAVAIGQLGRLPVHFERKATVCKYVVPSGYPSGKGAGDPVEVPPDLLDDPRVRVYWAAATLTEVGARLTGSRALAVVGLADELREAERIAEAAAGRVGGNVRHRRDIGKPSLVARRVEHMRQLRGVG